MIAITTTIYLDTEFSELSDNAKLISVGAITEAGETFYLELAPLPEKRSQFVQWTVLPQLEGGTAACPRAEFSGTFAAWLRQWADPRLVVDSDWDIYVLRKELTGCENGLPGLITIGTGSSAIQAKLDIMPPVPQSEAVLYDDARREQQCADPRAHHALADAKAFRAGALARRDWK